MSNSAIAIIPARFASTRFPGKPLALLAGRPMIQHVVERVRRARGLSRVLVATDDERIASAVRAFGGEVAMTGDCRTGTDRVWQAARSITPAPEVVLNVQGDEPLIDPTCLEALLSAFADPAVQMATLRRPIAREKRREAAQNPNVVKVVCAQNGDALYFSRAAIPFDRDGRGDEGKGESDGLFAHVGVYAYRTPFLARVAAMESTPLERLESLEQLRVLENGHRIRTVETLAESHGVDTPEDLARVAALLDG